MEQLEATTTGSFTTAADSGDLDYSDDEAIGDWVWKSSQTAKLFADNVGSCDGGVKRGVGTEGD